MHTQHSLLRAHKFHLRLGSESLHHIQLLLGEGVHGTGGECRHWEEYRMLSLTVAVPHKQLVIHDA